MKFVDVYAGCGGISLGLSQGWTGLFAVEHERFSFQTLEANFLDADLAAVPKFQNTL